MVYKYNEIICLSACMVAVQIYATLCERLSNTKLLANISLAYITVDGWVFFSMHLYGGNGGGESDP